MMPLPTVTVILPVRNEALRIAGCLESIVNQDLAADRVEILAIDGMSGDGTREILRGMQGTHANIHLIDNPRKSVTAALNIGIQAAHGDFIVRCDAHAAYAPDYLSSCLAVAEATGAGNVGGHARSLPGGATLMARAIMLAHASFFGLGGARFRGGEYEGYVDTVWPGCYRRELFAEVGGYNELLPRSEDIELNARLRKAGHRCYLSKRIRAWYYCRPDLASLFRQRFLDGIGVVRTLPVNAAAVGVRHLIPLVFAASLLACGILAAHPVFRTLLLAETGAYSAALIFFSLAMYCEERKPVAVVPEDEPQRPRSPAAALLLPPVFITLHAAYGLGSLLGIATLPFFMRRLAS
jgi:GT2 family glycosyltransferase